MGTFYTDVDDKEHEWEQLCHMGLYTDPHGILHSSSEEREEVRRAGSQPEKARNKEREYELQEELLH